MNTHPINLSLPSSLPPLASNQIKSAMPIRSTRNKSLNIFSYGRGGMQKGRERERERGGRSMSRWIRRKKLERKMGRGWEGWREGGREGGEDVPTCSQMYDSKY